MGQISPFDVLKRVKMIQEQSNNMVRLFVIAKTICGEYILQMKFYCIILILTRFTIFNFFLLEFERTRLLSVDDLVRFKTWTGRREIL